MKTRSKVGIFVKKGDLMRLPVEIKNKKILLAGIGGGYDILGTVPLWLELQKDNEIVFSNCNNEINGDKFNLMTAYELDENYVEYRFQKLLIDNGLENKVYAIPYQGEIPTTESYKKIVKDHNIDLIIATDSGVDSLMRGDEENSGTLLEDTISIMSISRTDIPSYLACVGFGTETEENLNHYCVLQNMAYLYPAFLGCCALTFHDENYQDYFEIAEFLWKNHRKSHIHTKIISAICGLFGDNNYTKNTDARLAVKSNKPDFINPLMTIYWFYNLEMVAVVSDLAKKLTGTNTRVDVLSLYREYLDIVKNKRKKEEIPL